MQRSSGAAGSRRLHAKVEQRSSVDNINSGKPSPALPLLQNEVICY